MTRLASYQQIVIIHFRMIFEFIFILEFRFEIGQSRTYVLHCLEGTKAIVDNMIWYCRHREGLIQGHVGLANLNRNTCNLTIIFTRGCKILRCWYFEILCTQGDVQCAIFIQHFFLRKKCHHIIAISFDWWSQSHGTNVVPRNFLTNLSFLSNQNELGRKIGTVWKVRN